MLTLFGTSSLAAAIRCSAIVTRTAVARPVSPARPSRRAVSPIAADRSERSDHAPSVAAGAQRTKRPPPPGMPGRPTTWACGRRRAVLKRFAAFALVVGVMAACAGCSTPRTAAGSLDQGKQRVTQLVLEVAHALPPTVQFRPPTEVGTQSCRKTLAGYDVGSTGAHRAQVPLIVYPPKNVLAASWLPRIEAVWAKAGYRLDRSRIHETRFPQVRAVTPDGYDVVATAFAPPPQGVTPQIDLYAVSQCLRGVVSAVRRRSSSRTPPPRPRRAPRATARQRRESASGRRSRPTPTVTAIAGTSRTHSARARPPPPHHHRAARPRRPTSGSTRPARAVSPTPRGPRPC